MKWNTTQASIATLAYGEMFQYPLDRDELTKWYISDEYRTNVPVPEEFNKLQAAYDRVKKKRMEISKKKWEQAKLVALKLGKLPTIQLIGISGGLAMNNADEEDDIDIFIIVSPGTIWITRLFILTLLEVFGVRRKVYDVNTKNTLCPNMFVDKNNMVLPVVEQDLYSAHEVLQMVPIVSKNDTYTQFLYENEWVKDYLMNAWVINTKKQVQHISLSIVDRITIFFLRMLEIPAKYLQLWIMHNHRTTEIITDEVLRFHPRDFRETVRIKYKELLHKYNVPLDSRFLKSLK